MSTDTAKALVANLDINMTGELSKFISSMTGIKSEPIQEIINLVMAIVAIYLVFRLIEGVILKYIRKKGNNTKIAEAKLNTIYKMLEGLFKFLTFLFIIIQVLIALGVSEAQIFAVVSTLSVAVGFAAQGIVKDLINGVIIIAEDQYKLGDFCEINGLRGEVEKLTMRVTQLRDVDGSLHIIPNSSITQVTTMSKDFVKAIIVVGIEYSANTAWVMDKLKELMAEVYKEMPDKLLQEPKVLGISAFQDSCIDIKIICETAIGEKYNVEYALRLKIKEMFDKEGIVIPFPQRDVNIVG